MQLITVPSLRITGEIRKALNSEHDALRITEWFPNIIMKLNKDKYHLIVFCARGGNEITIKIGDACVKERSKEIFSVSLSINHFLSKNISRPCIEKLAKSYMLLPASSATWTLKNCIIYESVCFSSL